MGYSTASTSWPASIPSSVKDLVDNMFSIVDINDPNSGERLAKEVFTEDGKFYARDKLFEGTKEISGCRKDAWKAVSSRRHEILKVYLNDEQGTSLVIFGTLEMSTLDGAKQKDQFVAQAVLRKLGDSTYKVSAYEIWAAGPKVSNF